MKNPENNNVYQRYVQLQKFVGWSQDDVERILLIKPLVEPDFREMIDDFYNAIAETEATRQILTGGEHQILQLKKSLLDWIEQLFSGDYDAEYVSRRLRVGRRHVEIGLDQVYVNVSMSRLRTRIIRSILDRWQDETGSLADAVISVNRIIDLDLAIIEDAYQQHYSTQQKREERYATIGKISGGIAHEIRNPLNVMKTSIYFLKNANSIEEDKRQKHLTRIEDSVDEANRIITTLTEFSRLQQPTLTPLSIRKLIDDAVEKIVTDSGSSSRSIRISITQTLEDDRIMGESSQLLIVLGNLIRNACQAMENNGELNLIICEKDGKKAVIVKDNGHGIASEKIELILEPLFTTKPKGIGLGLAISKSILDAHKAELVVESLEGVGSEFAVLFPLRERTP